MIQVVDFCRRTIAQQGRAPTYSMIRAELGLAENGTVRRYVKQAEAAGLLTLGEYRGGRGAGNTPRIRFGLPSEADATTIKMGRDL
jgi:hypothetical protein